jgi:hypothetical protein
MSVAVLVIPTDSRTCHLMKGVPAMDIYSILSSKPHNSHYLNKYTNFIEKCQLRNKGFEGYTENHHICPKAKDMFPEYTNLKETPWNCAILTARQHFIAHMMLCKVYKDVYSVASAAWAMKHKNGMSMTSKSYENLKSEFSRISSEVQKDVCTLKDESGNIVKIHRDDLKHFDNLKGLSHGKVTVIDSYGNTMQVDIDDPRYINGDLVPFMKGKLFVKINGITNIIESNSYDSNQHHFHRKGKATVKDRNGNTFTVDTSDERYKSREVLPIHQNVAYGRNSSGEIVKVETGDKRFKTGELSGNNRGKFWITNGKQNKMITKEDQIPFGYVMGKTQREDIESVKNTIFINNGNITKRIGKDEEIPIGWFTGIAKNKIKPFRYINDGIVTKKILPEQKLPDGFRYGMVKRNKSAAIN